MDNSNKYFQKKLNASLESSRIPYDNEAWERLSAQLDVAQNSKPSRNKISAAWLLLLLPMFGWNYSLYQKLAELKLQTETDKAISNAPNVYRNIIQYDTIEKIYYRDIYKYICKHAGDESLTAAVHQKSNSNDFHESMKSLSENNNRDETKFVSANMVKNKIIDRAAESSNMQNEIENKIIVAESITENMANEIKKSTTEIKLNQTPEDLSFGQPQLKLVKKRNNYLKLSSVWFNAARTIPISATNEINYSAGVGLRINENIELLAGIQTNSDSDLKQHDEIEILFPAPMPHLADDKILNVDYQTKHFSFPIQIVYEFKKRKNSLQPFVNIGYSLQQHRKTQLTYNYATINSQLYYIDRNITDKHWNSFVTAGAGIYYSPFAPIDISFSVLGRQAMFKKHLLVSERHMIFGTLGIRYKF